MVAGRGAFFGVRFSALAEQTAKVRSGAASAGTTVLVDAGRHHTFFGQNSTRRDVWLVGGLAT